MKIQAIFSANMKKYRKKANMTQEKLAEMCSTDHRYIGQIENGLRCPSLEYVERIASALNIAPYLLFYDETNGLMALDYEQKQKLKTMLFENFSHICTIIDEKY